MGKFVACWREFHTLPALQVQALAFAVGLHSPTMELLFSDDGPTSRPLASVKFMQLMLCMTLKNKIKLTLGDAGSHDQPISAAEFKLQFPMTLKIRTTIGCHTIKMASGTSMGTLDCGPSGSWCSFVCITVFGSVTSQARESLNFFFNFWGLGASLRPSCRQDSAHLHKRKTK